MYIIENQNLKIEITTTASEILSIRDKKTNIEYIWNGDPKYWSQRNPTLFPMVGSVYDGNIRIQGKIYHMKNHGFARHSEFQCIYHDTTKVVMELTENEETLAQYPFPFLLQITYELIDRTLNISYLIKNTGQNVLPFHFGLHPAFMQIADNVTLTTDQPETYQTTSNHYENRTTIDLNPQDLMDTIMITNPKSSKYRYGNDTHGIILEAANYPYVAFWKPKADAPMLCIEPWYSHTDFEPNQLEYDQREGVIKLNENENFECSYSIHTY